jgi:hypothetical protein
MKDLLPPLMADARRTRSGLTFNAPRRLRSAEEGTPECHPIAPAIALVVSRLEELERQKRSESVRFGL